MKKATKVLSVKNEKLHKLSKSGMYDILRQLLIIFIMFSAFYLSALLSPATQKMTLSGLILCIAVFSITVILAILAVLFNNSSPAGKTKVISKNPSENRGWRQQILDFLIREKYPILLIIITIALRLPMMSTLQIGASGEYYRWALAPISQDFDFSLSSFFKLFRFYSHPSLGYGSLLGIGEFLLPQQVTGVLISKLVLTCFAVVFLFKLLKGGYWYKVKESQAAIGALFLSCIPLFYGLFGYIDLDYGVVIFLIFTIYMEYRKKFLLFLFWSLMLCQSKETGAMFLAAYVGSRALYQWLVLKGNRKEKVGILLRDPVNIAAIIAGVIFAAYLFFSNGPLAWLANAQRQNDPAQFRISLTHIRKQLSVFTILNFHWLLVLLSGISLFVYYLKNKFRISGDKNINFQNIFIIIGILAMQGFFSLIFVTYEFPRYIPVWSVFLAVFTVIAMFYLWDRFAAGKKYPYMIAAVLTLLMIGQTFYSIDPLSNLAFAPVETGKPGVKEFSLMDDAPDHHGFHGEWSVYNFQFTWAGRAVNHIMKEVGYSTNMDILIFGYNQFIIQQNFHVTSWNTKRGTLSVEQGKDAIGLSLKYMGEVIRREHLRPKALVYFLPFSNSEWKNNPSYLAFANKYYNIGEKKIMNDYAGMVEYYVLTLKDK